MFKDGTRRFERGFCAHRNDTILQRSRFSSVPHPSQMWSAAALEARLRTTLYIVRAAYDSVSSIPQNRMVFNVRFPN